MAVEIPDKRESTGEMPLLRCFLEEQVNATKFLLSRAPPKNKTASSGVDDS
jgi:hypothetical protein